MGCGAGHGAVPLPVIASPPVAGMIAARDDRRRILCAEVRVFGTLGVPELVLIFVVALLLFGPRKMPQIGRSVGRALSEFRRASNEFKRTIEDEVAAEDIRDVERDIKEVKTVGRDLVDDVKGAADPSSSGARDTV